MLRELSERETSALYSFLELLCQYWRAKKLKLPQSGIDRQWFIDNRRRIACLDNTPGREDKFTEWLDHLEEGNKKVWILLLGDLSSVGVSIHMYSDIKKYSPFAGKIILTVDHFPLHKGVNLSKNEGAALMNNVCYKEGGETFIVISNAELENYP
jgi:hypothetical protein